MTDAHQNEAQVQQLVLLLRWNPLISCSLQFQNRSNKYIILVNCRKLCLCSVSQGQQDCDVSQAHQHEA